MAQPHIPSLLHFPIKMARDTVYPKPLAGPAYPQSLLGRGKMKDTHKEAGN